MFASSAKTNHAWYVDNDATNTLSKVHNDQSRFLILEYNKMNECLTTPQHKLIIGCQTNGINIKS